MCPECRNTFHSYPHRRQSASVENIYDARININRMLATCRKFMRPDGESAFEWIKIRCSTVRGCLNHWFPQPLLSSYQRASRNVVRKPKNKSCKQLNSLPRSPTTHDHPTDKPARHRGKSFPIELFCLWFRRKAEGARGRRKVWHKGNTEHNKIIKSMIRLFCQAVSDVGVRRDEGFNHQVNILPFYATYDTRRRRRESGRRLRDLKTRRRIYRTKILA